MSTYVREKVLRIPESKINLEKIKEDLLNDFSAEDIEDDLRWCLESKYPDLFGYGDCGKFQVAPTEEYFIDYVLEYDWDSDGDYGKIRTLYESEKLKYLKKFQFLDPNVDMNDVHLVEFCYYNGCEAPDYYDELGDSFYDEV